MKKILYVAAIAVVVLGVQKLYDVYGTREAKEVHAEVSDVIANVFNEEGIDESECDIEGYYYYGSMYLSEEGSHELLGKAADGLGVESEYEYYRERTSGGYTATLLKEGADSTLLLKLITVEKEENENLISQQQYISINLKLKDSIKSGFYYRKLIETTMKKLFRENEKNSDDYLSGGSERHNYADNLWLSVKGKIYGAADVERQKKIAGSILDGIGAEQIFDNEENVGVKDDKSLIMYSIYAYTPDIDDYAAIGSEKINVNIVFSYDEENNITYIHAGSPIINYDY